MANFDANDRADSLSHEQLDFLSNTDDSWVIEFLKRETRFDENQIRLLCEMGRNEAKRRLTNAS